MQINQYKPNFIIIKNIYISQVGWSLINYTTQLIKAALMNTFLVTVGHMTVCNVKVSRTAENTQIIITQLFSFLQLFGAF